MDNSKYGIGVDAAILTGAKLFVSIISLVSAMLLSRYRSLDEYGTYSQILLAVNLATSIFMLGLPNSINFFLARCENKNDRNHYLSVYYTLNTLLCVLMGITLYIAEPLLELYFKNQILKDFVYILVLLPWTKVTASSISHVLIIYGKTTKLAVFNCISAALTLVSIIVIKILNGSFREYMLIYMIGEILIALWVYFIVWKLERPLRIEFDMGLTKSILAYSIPIGLSGIVGTLMLEADKLIIGHILNTESVAIYSNAAKELPFTLVSTSFTAVLVPQLVKHIKKEQKEEAIKLWGKTIEICFIFLMFIVTALVVFAPQIVILLYSEKYVEGTGIFRVYSLILLVRITSFGIILNATGRTKYILYTSIISLVINIALDYCLYYTIGFAGPAIATLLTLLIHAAALLVYSSKAIEINIKDIFPWKRLWNHLLYNVVWGVIVYFIIHAFRIGISSTHILICIIIGMIIGAIYIYLEKDTIKQLWYEINQKKDNKV